MEGGEIERKGRFDWNTMMDEDDDEAEPLLVVEKTPPAAADTAKRRKRMEIENEDKLAEQFQGVSDKELIDRITRLKRSLLVAARTPDGGEKFKINIKRHEDELERRKLQNKEGEKCKKPTQLHDLSASDGFREKTQSSISNPICEFTTSFMKKMEEKPKDYYTKSGIKRGLPMYTHSDRIIKKPNENQSSRVRSKGAFSTKQTQLRSCTSQSSNIRKQNLLNLDQKKRQTRSSTLNHNTDHSSKERNNSRDDTKNKHTVILDDDDDDEEESEVDESMKEATIYYPSRDDPESLEVRFLDLKCLAPQTCLESTIVNVYIRYLKQHKSKEGCDYHSLNTYFYSKLTTALSKDDWESSFEKLRRWWKGVSLFEKAYIIIPINDNNHWSLVIICIPDKENETGPLILHLDSLGYHDSEIIFYNIRRFLIREWEVLRKEDAISDLPMSNKIWDNLPKKICEKIIEVPKQKNEYDCGLFVLFFIERFIEESPERLKKKDLSMFGERWFKPGEASSLRKKIRDILKEEFRKLREKNVNSDA